MPRNVFFSFSYNDVLNFKANVIRRNWQLKNRENTFVDGSIWEKSKLTDEVSIKNIIDNGLINTSTTVVLIGQDTANRRWVNYEIIKSFAKGNGILGVHVNRIRGREQRISERGNNPLSRLKLEVTTNGKKIRFYELINGRWYLNNDIPEISNKKSNTLHFEDGWIFNEFGKSFRFSDKFSTYCWVNDDGNNNFSDWIETSVEQTKR